MTDQRYPANQRLVAVLSAAGFDVTVGPPPRNRVSVPLMTKHIGHFVDGRIVGCDDPDCGERGIEVRYEGELER